MKTCCLPPEVEIWGAIEVVVAEVPGVGVERNCMCSSVPTFSNPPMCQLCSILIQEMKL